jgi:hypothetical protein
MEATLTRLLVPNASVDLNALAKQQGVSLSYLLQVIVTNFLIEGLVSGRKGGQQWIEVRDELAELQRLPKNDSTNELAACRANLTQEREEHLRKIEEAAKQCFAAHNEKVKGLQQRIAELEKSLTPTKSIPTIDDTPPAVPDRDDLEPDPEQNNLLREIQRGKELKRAKDRPEKATSTQSADSEGSLEQSLAAAMAARRGAFKGNGNDTPKNKKNNDDYDSWSEEANAQIGCACNTYSKPRGGRKSKK